MNLFKPKKLDLQKIYQEHKHEFELLFVKDFVGYIPKEVQEPTLKCFKEYGEAFERWTLWQSWYINTRAMNDPIKLALYNGMMIYLKVIHTLAKVNKKNYQPPQPVAQGEVATPWINEALDGLKEFNAKIKGNKGDKNESTESTSKV